MHIFRITGTRLYLFPQTAHMHIHSSHIAAGSCLIAPDKTKQLFTAVHLARIADQKLQKIEFLGRQINLFLRNKNAAAVGIQLEISRF